MTSVTDFFRDGFELTCGSWLVDIWTVEGWFNTFEHLFKVPKNKSSPGMFYERIFFSRHNIGTRCFFKDNFLDRKTFLSLIIDDLLSRLSAFWHSNIKYSWYNVSTWHYIHYKWIKQKKIPDDFKIVKQRTGKNSVNEII